MAAIRRENGWGLQAGMSRWSARFVNDPAMTLALRETRGTIAAPRSWLALGVAALMIGLIGPFGTYDLLGPAGPPGLLDD